MEFVCLDNHIVVMEIWQGLINNVVFKNRCKTIIYRLAKYVDPYLDQQNRLYSLTHPLSLIFLPVTSICTVNDMYRDMIYLT